MATQRATPGLSIGQLVTLTFGFLIASVLIFAFGWWVGYDVAEQRLAREQQIVRLPVRPPPPAPTETAVPPTRAPSTAAATTATPPGATSTATRAAPAPTRTAAPVIRVATPTIAVAAERPAGETTSASGWTVQASATTDPVQAVVLARRLRAKGYDAYTVTAPIGGVMWYRTRVGRFKDRSEAKAVEERLRREEGLEAAFVAAQ